MYLYNVKHFIPKVRGCGAKSSGWDAAQCEQFQDFLNTEARKGWKLHSCENRVVTMQGCGGGTGAVLVCVFESQTP